MWQTASSKEIFNHPRLTLIEDEVILPNGAKINYLKYKDDSSCCATIIAKRDDGKILIQREYSYPSNQKLFQFPGGAIAIDEKPKVGANRELMEEAGYKASKLILLGSYLMDNRKSAMNMYVYVATGLTAEKLNADQEEEIESFWFTEDEIIKMIKKSEIINVHSLASWCLYKN